MALLRGVWSIVEDPFLRYFAIKFGYFPDEPVLVDKDVEISLTSSPPAASSSRPPVMHMRTPSFGAPAAGSHIRSSLGSEPNLADFLHSALAPDPPPTPISSLKLRLMSTHPLTQNNSIFCTPQPAPQPGSFGLLRSLSFPSFAMPDITFWKRTPNAPPPHARLGPALNCDSSVILHFHGGGMPSRAERIFFFSPTKSTCRLGIADP